jgi:gluconolactonase
MTRQDDGGAISRRTLVGAIAAGAAAAGSGRAMAQAEKGVPPSVVTSPPRQFGPHAPPNVYSDPDLVIVAVVGGPGLERAGPLCGVERHPE